VKIGISCSLRSPWLTAEATAIEGDGKMHKGWPENLPYGNPKILAAGNPIYGPPEEKHSSKFTVHPTSNAASKSASNGRKSIPREHLRPLHLQLRTPTSTSFRESGAEKAKTLVKQRVKRRCFYRKNDHDFTSNHLRHQGPLHLPMTYSTPHLPLYHANVLGPNNDGKSD
jgi:hypothetical protein